jgi:hypothetical protein
MDWSLIQFNWILIQNSNKIQLKKIWMQIGVKTLKIYLWLWCWEKKVEKTPFYSYLFDNFNMEITIWNHPHDD